MELWELAAVGIAGISGGYLIYSAYRNSKKATDSRSWRNTTGKVVNSWIEETYNAGDPQYGGGSYSYEFKITYSYSVMERNYKGHRIGFGYSGGSKSKARSMLEQYPVGSSVAVYYDPEHSEEAVLSKQPFGTLSNFLFGLLLLGGAIAFAIYKLTQ